MNVHLPNYAISDPQRSPKKSSHNRQLRQHSQSLSTYLLIGVTLLLSLLVIPVVWHIFTTTHNVSNEEEALRSPPSYYDDSDSQEFRLDMSKFQDDVSLNEFVNKELHRILPGVEMDEKFSVFLSSDISEKMMKLYHDESLNIFKTKVDEYDIHKNILKEKYNKGKSILLFK